MDADRTPPVRRTRPNRLSARGAVVAAIALVTGCQGVTLHPIRCCGQPTGPGMAWVSDLTIPGTGELHLRMDVLDCAPLGDPSDPDDGDVWVSFTDAGGNDVGAVNLCGPDGNDGIVEYANGSTAMFYPDDVLDLRFLSSPATSGPVDIVVDLFAVEGAPGNGGTEHRVL